jgi:hypothetical protein
MDGWLDDDDAHGNAKKMSSPRSLDIMTMQKLSHPK